MIIRVVKKVDYKDLVKRLKEKSSQNPLEACFHLTMQVDERNYIMKLQAERKRKLVILQAIETTDGETYRLITDNRILSSLIEFVIYEETAEKAA